jgi:hypothetical protein
VIAGPPQKPPMARRVTLARSKAYRGVKLPWRLVPVRLLVNSHTRSIASVRVALTPGTSLNPTNTDQHTGGHTETVGWGVACVSGEGGGEGSIRSYKDHRLFEYNSVVVMVISWLWTLSRFPIKVGTHVRPQNRAEKGLFWTGHPCVLFRDKISKIRVYFVATMVLDRGTFRNVWLNLL